MKVRQENNGVILELEGEYCSVTSFLSKEKARKLANSLIAAAEGKEDYLSLKKDDVIYYANIDCGEVEEGRIFSIYKKKVRVTEKGKRITKTVIDRFCVDFYNSSDFDELDGKCLGRTAFINRELAEEALANMGHVTAADENADAAGFNFCAVYDKKDDI